VLEAHGEGSGAGAESGDDRHLYDAGRDGRGQDALDAGFVVGPEQLNKAPDLRLNPLGRGGDDLPEGAGTRHRLNNRLS
jgi:hypothetical protein